VTFAGAECGGDEACGRTSYDSAQLTASEERCTTVLLKTVADTNTFLAVALREPEKDRLAEVVAGHDLIAPEVLPFEIGNALTAMVRKRSLAREEVLPAWEMAAMIPVELRKVDIRAAMEIAARFNIYAYDAYFLECAARFRAPLLTLDRAMGRVAKELHLELLELPE